MHIYIYLIINIRNVSGNKIKEMAQLISKLKNLEISGQEN